MRLVYFGSSDFGLPTLQRLVVEHDVRLIVTQPDRPAGRRRRLSPTPIAAFSERCGIELLKPEDANLAAVAAQIRQMEADALVVIAYGQKLGPALLNDTFAINLHGSLLPKYRGAAPINWAVINGETETGISVISMTQRMDAGAILAERATAIDPMETAGELEQRLSEMGPDLVLQTLTGHLSGDLKPKPQDDQLACHAPKLTKADGTVRFNQPAPIVQRRVHGLTPRPGCTVVYNDQRLRLDRVTVIENPATIGGPGEVLADGTIACAPGAVGLLAVQPAGGKLMSFDAYRQGHEIPTGSRLLPL